MAIKSGKIKILLILAAVLSGFFLIFFGRGIWLSLRPPTPEEKMAACRAELARLDDAGLVNRIITMPDPSRPIPEADNEEKMAYARKLLMRHLVYKTMTTGEEKYYELAEEFISRTKLGDDIKAERIAQIQERISDTATISMPMLLAFGDINEICPEQLPSLCLASVGDIASSHPLALSGCERICPFLEECIGTKETYLREIIGFNDWHSDPSIRKNQFKLRVSIAYRLGGEKDALMVCGNVSPEQKEDCLAQLEFLNGHGDRARIEDLLCRY